MKQNLFFVAALLFVAACQTNQEKKETQEQPKLLWAEEFEYDGKPDTNVWSHEIGYRRNNEKQYYTNALENCRVENGMLVIEARKEKTDSFNYSSASIRTKGKKDFLYGRIEVKAKLPRGIGTWPAIWMLGTRDDTRWPEKGEIDIMEYVGFAPDKIYANVHTKAYNHVLGTNKGDSIEIPEPYNDFHLYAIDWRKEKIDFFVDSVKYFSFQNEGTGNDTWPFDKPHYLLLNLAIGGAWGGQHGIDTTIFPQKYYIDYVRYYK